MTNPDDKKYPQLRECPLCKNTQVSYFKEIERLTDTLVTIHCYGNGGCGISRSSWFSNGQLNYGILDIIGEWNALSIKYSNEQELTEAKSLLAKVCVLEVKELPNKEKTV